MDCDELEIIQRQRIAVRLGQSLVDRATTVGDALVLAGAAGVGKTALLNAAAAYATAIEVRTVTVTGSQFEVDVSFAGRATARAVYGIREHPGEDPAQFIGGAWL